MTANLTTTIRRELDVLWEQASLAALTTTLYSKEQAIESAQDRIEMAVAAAFGEEADQWSSYQPSSRY